MSIRVIFTLGILSVTPIGSEGAGRRSVENVRSIKNGNEPSSVPNDSKTLRDVESRDLGLSSNEKNRNSPALNSFLKSVLQAQDELKWIDEAVRRVGAKETREKAPSRYLRSSLRAPASVYHNVRYRSKRRSSNNPTDYDESWTSSKRRYDDDDDKSARVYLDAEMKVKRHANPGRMFPEEGYGTSRRKQSRSALDDRRPVDDSTLRHWAKDEGLRVPGGWFESGQSVDKSDEASVDRWSSGRDDGDYRREIGGGLNLREDFGKGVEDWSNNPRDEREARVSWVKKSGEEPSLESLKRAVLELRKSLDHSDKKMDAIGEEEGVVFGAVKNRQRNAEDRVSGVGKGERETVATRFKNVDETAGGKKPDVNSRYDSGSNFHEERIDGDDRYEPLSSSVEISSGPNWWDDPRSAVDVFDLKKRDDDEDEDDDEGDVEPGNTEFDYMMRRVKRDKDEDDDDDGDEDGGERGLRVYRRAGFGGSYPDKETYDKKSREINKTGRIRGEIRDVVTGNKNDAGNTDGVENGEGKISADADANENGHSADEVKKSGDDNPAEESAVLKNLAKGVGAEEPAGTVGDSNLEEAKNAGLPSGGEKRSSESLRSREKEQGARAKSVKPGLEEVVKTGGEKESGNNEGLEKKEVEKSEPKDDDDVHKLSNENKKHEYREPSGEEKESGEKESGIKDDNEGIKTEIAKSSAGDSSEKISGKVRGNNEANSVDEVDGDLERESKFKSSVESAGSIDGCKVRRGTNERESKTVKLAEPRSSDADIKSTDAKNSAVGDDGDKSEVSGEIKTGVRDSKENAEELKDEKHEEGYDKRVIGYGDKDNPKLVERGDKEGSEAKGEELRDSGSFKREERIGEGDGGDLYTGVKSGVAKREDLTRKLLWLSEKWNRGSETETEIRYAGGDSSLGEKPSKKSGQRVVDFWKKNPPPEVRALRRSLMGANGDIAYPENNNNAVDLASRVLDNRGMISSEKRDPDDSDFGFGFGDGSVQLEKRSVDSYPENVDDDGEDDPRTSLENVAELRGGSDLGEEVYENEDEAVSQDYNKEEEGENQSGESEGRSVARFSRKNGDRDPMRDRINMLIKEKLDDRGKGKMQHFKREADNPAKNIEYYDYDSDVNGAESEVDSTVVEGDRRALENDNSTYPQVAIDKAPEPVTKKDENAEEERREESEQEDRKQKPPKEEFISDVELAKMGKKKSPSGRTITPLSESSEKSYSDFTDQGMKSIILQDSESRNDVNAKSKDRWLAQPPEADPEQEDDSADRQGRYRGPGEPGGQEKSLENERVDVLGEPLEYSVNVRGKLDPDSIDAILNDEVIAGEKIPMDNDNRNDRKSHYGTDADFKHEGIRGRSRSRQNGQRIGDDDDGEFKRDENYREKSSGRNWRSGYSARIEEGTNDRASLGNYFSLDGKNSDQIIRGKRRLYSRDTAVERDLPSGELDRDSSPTVTTLDRSRPGSLVSGGEKTYLVITPSDVKCGRKPSQENSSLSGSNYLALKITDDMFKGGMEQSNPIEDKFTDSNVMGKTTTEWKVIKMGEESEGMKSHYEGNGSASPRDDESNGFQNLGVNPRDVAHESIVDPEEMIGDFGDDTRPSFGRDLKCVRESDRRFGRGLQSVSYPRDPFERVHRKVADRETGEKPVDKYLEHGQTGFQKSETSGAGHRTQKRSAEISGDNIRGEGKAVRKAPIVEPEEKNVTKPRDFENFDKRSSGLETTPLNPNGDNGTEIDKGKRGLTNVEEWEMNAPTVQKQGLISGGENIGALPRDVGEKAPRVENNNVQFERNSEKLSPRFRDSATSLSHERESRSVKLGGENFKSDLFPASQKSPSHDKTTRRSKTGGKIIPRGKFRSSNSSPRSRPFAKYVPTSLDSRARPYVDSFDHGYNRDWKKLTPGKIDRERHRASSKSNEHERPVNHALRNSAKEDEEPDHRAHHRHPGLEKLHRDRAFRSKERGAAAAAHGNGESQGHFTAYGNPLKSARGHGERSFKELAANPVKSPDHTGPGSTGRSHDLVENESFRVAEGKYDSGSGSEEEKKVLDENAEEPAPRVIPEPDDTQKKKFKVLLAADNMEDESQMDLALHGELAGKIVERIFDRVQKNDALKAALGPGLYRKHKSEDAVATDKIYRQGLDEDEVKHTEGMMRRVMELLGRLILDEVQRKTCASLPPDMREFLQWMLGVEDEDRATDQVPPLPFVPNQEPNHRQDEKFLFEDRSTKGKKDADVEEMNKKVRLLRGLINEYNSLTDKEKTKVQTVHDYLEKQLGLLLKYIDAKEAEGAKTRQNGGTGTGNILQYQNAVPNANGSGVPDSTLSPLVNTPSILMLSNASFVERPRASSSHLDRSGLRETRSSEEAVKNKRHRKGKKYGRQRHPGLGKSDWHNRNRHGSKKNKNSKNTNKKKKKKKKKKNRKNHQHGRRKGEETPEYKKLIRRAAMLRKKRANLYADDWDPVDSGYEEPTIYTASGELTNKRRRSIWKNRPGLDGEREVELENSNGLVSRNEKGKVFDDEVDLGTERSKDTIDYRDEDSRKVWNSGTKISENVNGRSDESESVKKKRELFSAENIKVERPGASGMEVKRDVLSASIALQPWLNPKSDDLVSSGYLKELSNELVHGSPAPPVYSGGQVDDEEKPGTGGATGEVRNLANEESVLLSKREAWKTENEQQLEEVAFGKDMRGKWREKEEFEKLTGMDRKKNTQDAAEFRKKREGEDEEDSVVDSGVLERLEEDAGPMKNTEDKIAGHDDETVKNNHGTPNGVKIPEDINPAKKEEVRENPTAANATLDSAISQNFKNSTAVVADSVLKAETEGVKKPGKELSENEKKDGLGSARSEFSEAFKNVSKKNSANENRKSKRSPSLDPAEVDGSSLLRSLQISEQRERQKQAAKTEKDDQRDIADQMLGLESSPLTGVLLNTY